jgi:hypothetical protein
MKSEEFENFDRTMHDLMKCVACGEGTRRRKENEEAAQEGI